MEGEPGEQLNSNDITVNDLIEKLGAVLTHYNRIHDDKSADDEVSAIFKAIEHDFSNILIGNNVQDIDVRWSTPKGNWAHVPWISFLDKRSNESMSSGIYGCILFSKNMDGFYLTLEQGVSQYKKLPKKEGDKQLHSKNQYMREKLKYLSNHGFSLNDGVRLFVAPGSIGKDYEKGAILYKYYPKELLPPQEYLVKDILTVIDAYRAFVASSGLSDIGLIDKHKPIDFKIPRDDKDSVNEGNFLTYLSQRGFVFNPDTVISFLLSIKVKPFVILTGPSGSGKTKLAQLFAQYQAEIYGEKKEEFIVTDVKVGKSANHEGWTFPRTEFFNYYPELKKYQGQYEIEVDGIKGKGNLELLTRLFYESNDKIQERLEELAKVDPSRRITLRIIVPSNDTSNYEIVPVGANWTESRHIVGFYNLITKEYQRTKALDLILASQEIENERTPFFLILDEMNLSHVERYFADFLSAIESNERVPLHSNEAEKKVPTEIRFSPNLSIIGTVNVDETTYMFSPKVLDRANTIEILSESVSNYLLGEVYPTDVGGDMRYLENILDDALEIRSLTISQIRDHFDNVTTGGGEFWRVYSSEVDKFQRTLKEAGFDFGFRVANEISRFLLAAWRFEGRPEEWENWQHYLDMQIKQKMLPKVHGSERSLGKLIERLFQLCLKEQISKIPREYTTEDLREKATYLSSALKLKEMDAMLYSHRYVSFTR